LVTPEALLDLRSALDGVLAAMEHVQQGRAGR
jgi:hypothetical protein